MCFGLVCSDLLWTVCCWTGALVTLRDQQPHGACCNNYLQAVTCRNIRVQTVDSSHRTAGCAAAAGLRRCATLAPCFLHT
jgi:hypothetical protein